MTAPLRPPLQAVPPRDVLDVTHAAAMPPVAVLQSAWERAAAARGVRLHLDRLAPAYLVSGDAPPPAPMPDRGDNFRSLGRIAGAMSAEAEARMRARIARLTGGEDPKGAA